METKTQAVKSASTQAEEMRVQLRKLEQAAIKKGKYAKFTPEFEEVGKHVVNPPTSANACLKLHELLKKKIKEVDSIYADMKKSLGVK